MGVNDARVSSQPIRDEDTAGREACNFSEPAVDRQYVLK